MSIMSMFTNYNEESTTCPLSTPIIYDSKVPYGEYNAEGELVGYYWYYGDTINLQFDITGEISVDNNSIVYTVTGDAPTTTTVGVINQKAYNIVDFYSWTCTSIVGTTYTWTKDSVFTYPEDGSELLYMSAASYLVGKTAQINIYNFRYELIKTFNANASIHINVPIDKELSNKLIKGVYYLTLTIYDDNTNTYIPVIDNEECTIIVK